MKVIILIDVTRNVAIAILTKVPDDGIRYYESRLSRIFDIMAI
jgi:hypothetical protein